jgi:imidazole glycerol phosphate synthase glutamine amidotransferase subunit
MSQTIGVVDYGNAGNAYNIKKSLEAADSAIEVRVVCREADLKKIDKLVFPGVGTYRDVMTEIAPWKTALKAFIDQKPVLGICLGMQILSEKGYEFGETAGFAAIEGEVMKMPVKGRIPHIGWGCVEPIRSSVLLGGIAAKEQFYFMHSYELVNYKDVAGLTTYNEHKFVTVIERGHVFGVQFHPEKSREAGLKVFRNFLRF